MAVNYYFDIFFKLWKVIFGGMLDKDISAQVLKSMECKDLSRYVFKREGIVRHEIKTCPVMH